MKRAALACAVLALLGAVYTLRAAQKMPDFEVYWRTGARAAAAQPLYTPEDGHYQHKYLPAFAVLAAPFALLPLPIAKAVWFSLSIAVLGAFVAMSIALLPARRKRVWVLAACIVIAMAKFYGHELVLGQVNLLLGALIAGAVLSMRAARDVPAGILFAAAVVAKPYAILFLPWLAARRAWRALATAGSAIVGVLALPAALYGVSGTLDLYVEWWRTVSTSTPPNLLNADNVSLAGMFAKWMGIGAAASAMAVLSAAALLAIAADAVRRRPAARDALGLEAALLLTLIPMLSPQGWDYVFLLATPAIAFLVNYEDRLPRGLRIAAAIAVATAAFSLFDIMGRRAYGAFMALSIVTVCFLVVVAALYALRVRRVV